jgi:hypothetical protein
MKRALLALTVPGLATFATWQVTLGRNESDFYSVAEVAALVLGLLGIAVATGWLVRWDRRAEVMLACASAVAGVSKACWLSWADDITGLFMVGWMMVTAAAALGAFLVIAGTSWYREPRRPRPTGTHRNRLVDPITKPDD